MFSDKSVSTENNIEISCFKIMSNSFGKGILISQ